MTCSTRSTQSGPTGAAPPPRRRSPMPAARRVGSGPAGPPSDRSLGLDADGWRRFGTGLGEVVARCRDRGYEPTFHHETGTYVEAPWEIERVLEVSDIGLCLDTGHLLLAGGDPVAAIADWASRINQVHLKDARRSVMAGIVADGAAGHRDLGREAFPPLGAGRSRRRRRHRRRSGGSAMAAGSSWSRTPSRGRRSASSGRQRTSAPTASSCTSAGCERRPCSASG